MIESPTLRCMGPGGVVSTDHNVLPVCTMSGRKNYGMSIVILLIVEWA